MNFSDDEPPPAISSSSGTRPFQSQRVQLAANHNKEAPLEQHLQQVLLQVEVVDTPLSAVERSALDLVAVLDVSGSMRETRLNKMKTAMKFVIGKLGPMDRLSIVTFSDKAEKLHSLVCMTPASKEKLIKDVENRLKAGGGTNMKAGLETGLEVLAGRRHFRGRVGSIILLSDGDQNKGGNAEDVSIGNVAVYTFGFGAGEFTRVLEKIASNSLGGTFYFVRDEESLSEHFSQILAGLLNVVVQDLKLTVWEQRGHSEIFEVYAGGYPALDERTGAGSVTISFGDLYSGEMRKVIVNLLLPAVREYPATTLLFSRCSYSIQGKVMHSPASDFLRCDIRRTRRARPDAVKPEVKAELVRHRYLGTLRTVSTLKEHEFDDAKRKLEDAKRELEAEQQQSSPMRTMINILRTELVLLLSLSNWKDFISCLLASLTSHSHQRFASRGDVRSVKTFQTPAMVTCLPQATQFEKNPGMTVPSVDDDMKEEEKKALRDRRPPVADQRWTQGRIWEGPQERRSRRAWRAVIALCTVLAIAVVIAGLALLAVFLIYKPKMPSLVVSDARLGQLRYGEDGAIQLLQASITILAENNNSKAAASFSRLDLALGFHGAVVALLQADPFVVAPESSRPLRYNVQSVGQALDPAAMDEAMRNGVVPLDLFGKARTRWKVGVFVKLKFWTRLSCRLRFNFPGNGTVVTADKQKCRSRSP